MSTNRMGEPDWARFLKYVRKQDDGCWIWIGARRGNGRNEYGAFWCHGTQRAHIVAYVWSYGEPNADLHHACEQPLCVNPEHVTAAAGQPRHRNAIPDLCRNGHRFDGVNSRGERTCSTCLRAAVDRYQDANRDEVNRRRRERRVPVVHEERVCAAPWCDNTFVPARSTGVYCRERGCVNERQRLSRIGRLGGP